MLSVWWTQLKQEGDACYVTYQYWKEIHKSLKLNPLRTEEIDIKLSLSETTVICISGAIQGYIHLRLFEITGEGDGSN